jgi:hypothetical protein
MIDRRARVRKDLHPIFIPFYDALCAKLPEEWQPYSGIRSFASQDQKYAQGREKVDGIWIVKDPGRLITNAKGGESGHNYGMAVDWTLWTPDGEADWRDPKDLCWKELIDHVTAVGLRSGAEWGDVDHCELRISVPWKSIHAIWVDKGPSYAYASIQAAMLPPRGALA